MSPHHNQSQNLTCDSWDQNPLFCRHAQRRWHIIGRDDALREVAVKLMEELRRHRSERRMGFQSPFRRTSMPRDTEMRRTNHLFDR